MNCYFCHRPAPRFPDCALIIPVDAGIDEDGELIPELAHTECLEMAASLLTERAEQLRLTAGGAAR